MARKVLGNDPFSAETPKGAPAKKSIPAKKGPAAKAKAAPVALAKKAAPPAKKTVVTEEVVAAPVVEEMVATPAVAEAIGTSNPVGIPVPGPVLRAAARASELVGKITGREVFLTLDKVKDMLGEDWVCDSSSLRKELGWTPTVTFPELVSLMVDSDIELAAREKRARG